MKTFADNTGRTWEVCVNVHTVKAVRAVLDVDLTQAIQIGDTEKNLNTSLIDRLTDDPILLVDVLYVICREQAERLNVSDVQFGESLAGQAIADATKALLDEIVDFFPDAGRRRIGRLLLDGMTTMQRTADEKLEKMLDAPDFMIALNTRLATLSGAVTNAPESAALTPTGSPTPN